MKPTHNVITYSRRLRRESATLARDRPDNMPHIHNVGLSRVRTAIGYTLQFRRSQPEYEAGTTPAVCPLYRFHC